MQSKHPPSRLPLPYFASELFTGMNRLPLPCSGAPPSRSRSGSRTLPGSHLSALRIWCVVHLRSRSLLSFLPDYLTIDSLAPQCFRPRCAPILTYTSSRNRSSVPSCSSSHPHPHPHQPQDGQHPRPFSPIALAPTSGGRARCRPADWMQHAAPRPRFRLGYYSSCACCDMTQSMQPPPTHTQCPCRLR